MKAAIGETNRRRAVQERYNREHDIEPVTIVKGIRDINDRLRAVAEAHGTYATAPGQERAFTEMAKGQVEKLVGQMEAEMRQAARDLEFERAAALRDEIQEIRLRVLDEDASANVARAAERAAKARPARACGREVGTGSIGSYDQAGPAGGTEGWGPSGRRRRAGRVRPGCHRGARRRGDRIGGCGDRDGSSASTASDWLPGIRDEHEDDGWAAKWVERPTWDHTVTPNVIKRTGQRPGRGRRRR